MNGNIKVSADYFSLVNSTSLDSYQNTEKNIYQVLNDNIDCILRGDSIALTKNDHIVLGMMGEISHDSKDEGDYLAIYSTNHFKDETDFSQVLIGKRCIPSHFSFDLDEEIRFGNGVDYTKNVERLLKREFNRISWDQGLNDTMGLGNVNGKNFIYRMKNGIPDFDNDINKTGFNLLRKIDRGIEANPRVIA